MKEAVNTYLNLVFKAGLIIVLLSTFFLFTPLTTEFYDTPKFLILLIFVGIMLILTAGKYVLENRVTFNRTPFDLPLLLLLAVGIVSTILSPAPFVAFLGHNLRVHTSLVSLISYVLFYFVLTQNLKILKDVKLILNLCIPFGAVLSIITLLSYFGIKILPVSLTYSTNFTPIGSSFSGSAILALLLPIVLSRILTSSNFIPLILNSIFLILFGVTIALTGNLATWIAGIVGLLITFFVLNPPNQNMRKINLEGFLSKPSFVAIIASVVVVSAILVLSFIPPIGNAQNPLYTASKNFPRELQLGFITSWKISVSAFRDSPFWGLGPSTYLFNFTQYKPIEFNQTKFWNIRFDTSFNEYLQILANLGGVGLLAIIALTALFVSKALQTIRFNQPLNAVNVGLISSGSAFFIILLLHSSTLPLFLIGLLIFACFWIVNRQEQTFPLLHGTLRKFFISSEQIIRVEALPSSLLIASLVLVLFTGFFASKFYLADIRHRGAINAISQNNGVLAYNELIASEKLNPYNDLYRTDLAQINFALANAIAQAKGPTEASPSGSLTDQDKQNIQVLLQQSINEARAAISLNPRSAINWEILALLYRQIAGVAQNALLFSLDSYGRAIFNDPLNPNLRLNVGGVYFTVKNYDLAIRFFTDSINLKPDFANGFYNLSVALRDKGDLNAAIQAAERVVALVDPSSPDYKVATDYLADLKSKVSPPTPEQPPAAETTGALQEESLPKVIDLPKPEKIATPEAVKKPSPSPTPKP